MNIEQALETARGIVRKAADEYDDHALCFTGGKDSGAMLHLVEHTDVSLEYDVVFIDHGLHFDEVAQYADQVAAHYDYDDGQFIVARNDAFLDQVDDEATIKNDDGSAAQSVPISALPEAQQAEVERLEGEGWERPADDAIPWSTNNKWGNHFLKTWPLLQATQDHDAVWMAIRADEDGARSDSDHIEPAPHPEMEHDRVHPLVPVTLPMLWAYTKKEMIHGPAWNPLYDMGYSSLGAAPWTEPSQPGGEERAGRAQDKQGVMADLREQGYM